MERDLIRQIQFLDGSGNVMGQMTFDYLSPDAVSDDEFSIPRVLSGAGYRKTESLHWLSALAADRL